MEKTEQSKKNSLNKYDWKKWLIDIRDFFIYPILVIYLTEVSVRIGTKGLSLQCFSIDTIMQGLLIMGIIGIVINLLRKYIRG